jgi:hypoxanthine phosphoribosyltransferase
MCRRGVIFFGGRMPQAFDCGKNTDKKHPSHRLAQKIPLRAAPSHNHPHMRNDIERVLVDEEAIERRLDSMAMEIERDFPAGPIVVIILLKGALVFAADLLRRIPRELSIECLNVASYHGGLESSGTVDFLDRHFPEVRGKHVLLLDDILDTGRTLAAVAQRLKEEGAAAVHTGVLLTKDKERAEEVDADYIGFGIGDEFVVGYGLDYKGKYRNLPYVGVLKLSAAT